MCVLQARASCGCPPRRIFHRISSIKHSTSSKTTENSAADQQFWGSDLLPGWKIGETVWCFHFSGVWPALMQWLNNLHTERPRSSKNCCTMIGEISSRLDGFLNFSVVTLRPTCSCGLSHKMGRLPLLLSRLHLSTCLAWAKRTPKSSRQSLVGRLIITAPVPSDLHISSVPGLEEDTREVCS